MELETVRNGSTRIMRAVKPGVLSLTYTDQWSAFDRGPSSQIIPGIGRARYLCAVRSFELAHSAGLPTHFIGRQDPQTLLVQEFAVPGSQSLSGKVHGRVLPLEWIWRAYVKGSLWARIQAGEIDPVTLGFPPGIKVTEGMKLPRLIIECTTKFETTDRHLSDEEARDLAKLTQRRWNTACELVRRGQEVIGAAYESEGFYCPDGKDELGMKKDGTIVFVDVFGTPDENRIIEISSGQVYSKDILREYLNYVEPDWKKALGEAKKAYPDDKNQWPTYPLLPRHIKELVSERYKVTAHRYAHELV